MCMDIKKFTQKSVEAVQGCERLAYEYGNQEIEQEHLLYSLLTLEDSLILKLIEKMEINKEHFLDRVRTALEKRTKVQGGQLYFGEKLNKALVNAENESKAMGDEYVSVEHLFVSLIKNPNAAAWAAEKVQVQSLARRSGLKGFSIAAVAAWVTAAAQT